jgi:hypothetical protein
LFTRNSIFKVGSSIVIAGIGSAASTHEIVSHTNISDIHAIVTISHANASSVSFFSSHSFVKIFVILAFLSFPSLFITKTFCHTLTVPSYILPIPNLPRKLS